MTEVALKKGWTRVAFGDVVKLSGERSSNPEVDGFERFVGLEHIDPGDLTVRRWGNIADGTTFTTVFRPGQVLFGKRRAYQRKVAVAGFSGVCSSDIYVLEPKTAHLLPELIPFICQTDGFFEHAVGTSAGSLSPRTNWGNLGSYELALPPLDEQRRLVAVFVATESALESLTAVEYSAERARRSVLLQTFRPSRGPRDVFPRQWSVMTAGTAGLVQLGERRHPGLHTGTNMRPYLRVANVMDGWLDLADVARMHFPPNELHKYELRSGDILLNEGQSTELVGRSAIYRGEIEGVCFQMTLLRFRCGEQLVPEFSHAFFQHCLYTGQFARLALQTTSMAHLTAVRFERLPMPVPPMGEQRRIVERIRALNDAVRSTRLRKGVVRVFKSGLMKAALGWK